MHGGMRQWRRGGIAVAVLALALAGCSPDDPTPTQTASSATAVVTPSVEPTPTPSVEPTPTPTAAPKPVLPPEMANGDEAGAIAAVKYFLELYAYAFGSGDTSALAAMSAPECDFCSAALSDITSIYESGGHATGGTPIWEPEPVAVEALGNGVFQMALTATQTAIDVFDGSGNQIQDGRAVTMTLEAGAVFESGNWLIIEIGKATDE